MMDRQTYTTDNISVPQLRWWAVIKVDRPKRQSDRVKDITTSMRIFLYVEILSASFNRLLTMTQDLHKRDVFTKH